MTPEETLLLRQAAWLLKKGSSATPGWHDAANRVIDGLVRLAGYPYQATESSTESTT
jgi:hypothetical protein